MAKIRPFKSEVRLQTAGIDIPLNASAYNNEFKKFSPVKAVQSIQAVIVD